MPLADRGLLTVIIASCQRGANTLVLAAEPIEVNECNCSICRRYGVLWAYYAIGDVTPTAGAADIYSWDDRSIAFHRCSTCGCVTHWAPIDRNEQNGSERTPLGSSHPRRSQSPSSRWRGHGSVPRLSAALGEVPVDQHGRDFHKPGRSNATRTPGFEAGQRHADVAHSGSKTP